MAAAASVKDEAKIWERKSSYDMLPPNMSELRVVLLGNSWSQRSSVGNFILGTTVFTSSKAPDCCQRVSGRCIWKETVVINTPDLLHPNVSEEKLTELIENCVRLSDPGPHVFLLVLQPEDFTEEQKLRLQTVLENFGEGSFEHSLVLISTPTGEPSGFVEKYEQHPPLKHMIKMCRYRSLRQKNLELQQLFTRLCQLVKENDGEHVVCDLSDKELPGPVDRGLRIVLFGKSEEEMTNLCNFIMKKKYFNFQKFCPIQQCEVVCGEWRGKPLTVVKTPDMFSLSVEEVRREVKSCVSLCSPGPNVLLLLVKPSDFTEENRQTLKFILSLFGEDVFRFSMVVSTYYHQWEETSVSVNKLLQECGGRHYNIYKSDHSLLMQMVEDTVHENTRTFLTFTDETMKSKSENIKPSLNLVLCGSRAAEKTSAAEAILGQTELHSVSSSSECVKHQGEVCGRWVSLVELPALSGKPQEEVMKESFRCISLCDPEGVNAFILVLPVGPLTDEDKVELETIQKTFSSRVNDFTMILFTVESDPKHPAVVNFVKGNSDVQRISQSCGGRSVVLNIKDKQQIPELLETVEKMRHINKPCGYTTDTFVHVQIEKNIQLESELNKNKITCEETQSPESLRIVLLGKTGCGKSSSGNTILRRDEFKADFSQTSVTKYCHKSESKVDGRHVVVVDTPGLFDSNLSHDQINEEMVKCISLLAPGPHVFLLVIQIGRFTPEEKETVRLIKEAFGKNSEKFTIVLLTGGDLLERNNMSVEEFIDKKCDGSFKKLISDCGGRYHVFNNLDEQNHTQASELIKKFDTMVKENGGSCFTNDLLQEAEAAIKKEMKKNLKETEEEMKREREELERKHKEEKEEMERKLEEQKQETENERKERKDQLKEIKKNIKKEREQRKKEEETREEENRKREKEEEKRGLDLKKQLEQLDKLIQSEKEEKKSVNRELEKSRDEMRQKQETWEKKQEQWRKERRQEEEQRRQEEQMRIAQLEEKYEKEREKSENKRQEEDHNRRKLEKQLEEKYKTYLETLKKTYEDEARKKAEEVNEFKEEYRKRFAAQKEHEEQMKEKVKDYDLLKALSVQQKHQEISDLIKCLRERRKNLKKITELLDKQEKEMETVKNEKREILQKKHFIELSDLIKKLQQEERGREGGSQAVDDSGCVIL